jgi:hypothetical protein
LFNSISEITDTVKLERVNRVDKLRYFTSLVRSNPQKLHNLSVSFESPNTSFQKFFVLRLLMYGLHDLLLAAQYVTQLDLSDMPLPVYEAVIASIQQMKNLKTLTVSETSCPEWLLLSLLDNGPAKFKYDNLAALV